MSSGLKGKFILLWVVGFFVLLFLVYFLFVNIIIKFIFEFKLGEFYGVEVNIDEFDYFFFLIIVMLKGIVFINFIKFIYN